MNKEMKFPLPIEPKLLNPGESNADRPHCIALTYFQGQLNIAYGSANKAVIVSSNLSIVASLDKHENNSYVTALAWAPYSGRLTSAATDNKIIIWEPDEAGWHFSQELVFTGSPLECLSWSMCDRIFCTCSDQFTIYHRNIDVETKTSRIERICFDDTPTIFCSHSRDSRFILTIPKTKNDVILFHKREKSTTEYCQIHILHPSRVTSARWRTSDQLHERCCFMTIAEDQIVRIWSETSVNEKLMFNVVAAIPSKHHIVAANFISTTSRLVSNNPIFKNVQRPKSDTYAYGHGHFPIRDRDTRDANIADQKELDRNHFWFLTIDRNQQMIIWEMSGISSNVRRTPTITQYTQPVKLGISSSAINQIFAFCRLESEYSHLKDNDFIGKPSSLSLFIQDRATKVLTTIDISLDKKLYVNHILHTHGHHSAIKIIRIHQTHHLMVSMDSDGYPILWRFDDTDVYDPSVLIHFYCQFDIKLKQIDWLPQSSSLLAYDGKNLMVIDLPRNPTPLEKPKYRNMKFSLELASELNGFSVVCELSGGYIFYAISSFDLHIMWLHGDHVHLLKHIPSKHQFSDYTNAYITQLLPYAGATICFYSTKNTVYVAYMTTTGKITHKNMANVINIEKCITLNDKIRGLCVAHPGYLFIACDHAIHICWRVGVGTHEFRILHTIPINYKPIKIKCIPTGLVSVTSKQGIHLYYPVRESSKYQQSNLKAIEVACYQLNGVTAMEWTLDGILLLSVHNKVFAFTKFMDTFFLDVQEKLPTFHHTLAHCSQMISDFHPSTMIPIVISGRLNLLLRMLKFLNTNYNNKTCRWFYADLVLIMKLEHMKPFEENVKVLIEELTEKITTNPFPEFSGEENNLLLKLIGSLPKILELPPEFLDVRGMAVVRAITLSSRHMISFDLINLASLSQDQTKILSFIDFKSWESIENSGVFFWINDIPSLASHLIPFSISSFEDSKHLSIILLTILQKFVVLKQLFKKAGDDTRAQFFLRDFNKDKEKKSAEKNGYSALSKQDYHIAAAMFILAGKIEIAVRIIMQNLNDLSLAYFVCRCKDNGIGFTTTSFINEIIFPLAQKENDHAAIDFFKRQLDPEISNDVSERYQSSIPGNIIPTSNFFCDERFVSCEILRTTLDQKADLCLCFILSGHFLLSCLFLGHFDVFNLKVSEDFTNSSVNSIHGLTNRSRSIEFNKNVSEHLRSNSLAIPPTISKLIEDIDDEEESDKKNVDEVVEDMDSFSFGFTGADAADTFDYYSSNSDDEEEDEENFRSLVTDSNNASLIHPSPSMMISEGIENFNPDLKSRKPMSYGLGITKNAQKKLIYAPESEEKGSKYNNIPKIPTKSTSKENLNENPEKIIQQEQNFNEQPEIKRKDNFAFGFDGLKESCFEWIEEEEDLTEDFEESMVFNWFIIVVVFNIARNRLESFLETQHDFHEFNQSIAKVHTEIISAGQHLASMQEQLQDYLIRSCKRRCFVFRRILLLSNEKLKRDYITELCKYLAQLPDQMMASTISPQQAAQITQTVKCLIRFINQKVLSFENNAILRYVISSIITALYVLAIFYHNSGLMKVILSLDLTELDYFPDSIANAIDIGIVGPCEVDYNHPHSTITGKHFSFLSIEKSQSITKCFPQFAASFIDFMLIDTLYRHMSMVHEKSPKYIGGLIAFIRKFYDLYVQLFAYATLNFHDFVKFKSLDDLVSDFDNELKDLILFLINMYDRRHVIPLYCKSLLTKFSYKDLKHFKIASNHMTLQKPRVIGSYKTAIRDICINKFGNGLFITTKNGLEKIDISKYSHSEEIQDQDDNISLIPNMPLNSGSDTLDLSSELSNDSFVLPHESSEEVIIHQNEEIDDDFSPKIIFADNPEHIQGHSAPICIARHPTDNYALLGDFHGKVWLRSFSDSNECVHFETSTNQACGGLSFANDGTMFASAHGSKVNLWSLSLEDDRTKPFSVIETFSKEVVGLEFLQGTGLIVTAQIQSQRSKANLAFWDVLMNNSMVSSLKLKDRFGTVNCMAYTPRLSEIFVGTTKGCVCTIDTRQFQVINSWKCYEKKKNSGVSAIAVDNFQTYVATGSTAGSLKLWDIQTSKLIGQMKNLHKTKTFHIRGKMREFGITAIDCHDEVIFTGGIDGIVHRIAFVP
ncbi:hypothetical protein TRFO_06568 [Tritrichomonas foetus]|uniref:RAVE complex protein Rav1 C-terminal domain-containing protein n=1 Tax=Tritrichomonas foetus TaxID=1144522 RepID=A0A1J4K2L3_9EUKA|nr:hypothetical protein TRFO_06568 [Tritrichomonas foetus]|eukprot:OHT03733.1 hypothetical protein TRFO_06568 [Tritrichomonas foetus]